MESSVLSKIKQFIQPELIDALSANSTDSKEGIHRAFDVAIPLLLSKFQNSDSTVWNTILTKAQHLFADSSDFQSKLEGVSSLVATLFSTNYNTVTEQVSQYANISNTSADSVLKTSMIGVLNYFKNISPTFDLSTIKNFISNNLTELKGLLPASLAGLAGLAFGNNTSTTNANINKVVNENETNQYKTNNSPYKEQKNNDGGGFWKVLIPLLLAVGAIFFFYKTCSKEKATVDNNNTTDAVTTETTTTTTTTTTRESLLVKLYNGTELNAYKGGIEEQLVAFLETGEYKTMTEDQLKEIWFDFDNLNFDTDSANITADSQIQLENIASILKAYPDAKIKIGGYTDRVGNEDYNKKLSSDRANAVKKYLSDKGFESQISGAEGYGSEHAKYAADAPEEDRVKDRRVSLSVRNK